MQVELEELISLYRDMKEDEQQKLVQVARQLKEDQQQEAENENPE